MKHPDTARHRPAFAVQNMQDIRDIELVPLNERVWSWDVADWLWKGCALDPNKPAVHFIENGDVIADPQVMTYEQLTCKSVQVANFLHELSVQSTDAVIFLLPNISDVYPLTVGTIARGVVCPLNWMLSKEHLAELICTVGAKVVVALGPTPGFDIWEKIQAIHHQLPENTRLFSIRGLQGTTPLDTDFDILTKHLPGDRLAFESAHGPDDIVAYIHSGGTTSSPKLVKLTHRGFVYKFWTLENMLGYGSQDVIFADYPFFHCAGFLNRLVAPIVQGMSVVIPSVLGARDKTFIKNYWKIVEKYGITQLSGVPTTLSLLAKSPPQNENVGSLRSFATTGSQALPVEVAKAIESKVGIKLILTYGSTESTTTLTQSPITAGPRYGSTGLRLPYTRIKAVKLNAGGNVERECEPNEIGVVVAKGPGITPGYLIDSHNGGLFTHDGWLKSGDLGRIDKDGYLWLTGRAKDLIIRGGHNIDPSPIEEALLQHPAVLYAAAVGKPDGYAGELPVAYVQLTDGACCSEDELKLFVSRRIHERAANPDDIFVVDEIPLSDVRKPLKNQLKLDAARRTFAKLLQKAVKPHYVEVNTFPHPEYGTLIVIRTDGPKTVEFERSVAEVMMAFTMPYKLEWLDDIGPSSAQAKPAVQRK